MRRSVLVLAVAALLSSVPAAAQDGFPFDRGAGRPKGARLSPEERERVRAEVQRKVKTYVAVELSSRLGLDEKKAMRLSEAVGAHMERKAAARKALRQEHEKLRQLVEQGADDKALSAQIQSVSRRAAAMDVHDELLADCATFLTVKEQAKLVLAVPDVMREVGRMARGPGRGLREGRRGPGARGDDVP